MVIMGCGRVGATLAQMMEKRGHHVAVIDQTAEAFRRLGPTFEGRTVTGVGFDPDVLRDADIEQAGAFAAVSSGDNSNVISARVARETFGVQNVAARIYDPGRAVVYQKLGIPTVATVTWTANQLARRLFPEGSQTEWVDPSGSIRLAEVHLDERWLGRTVAEVEEAAPVRVAFLTRLGDGFLPGPHTVLQDGDLLHAMMRVEDSALVADQLGVAPKEV